MRQSSPARQLLFKEYEDHNNNNIANQIIASHHNNNNTNSAYDSLSPQEKKTLRETTSLFICCRNLFSIQQIRFLGHLTQLTVLNLHMNNIKKIPPMVLSHLTHLEELDLSANEIGTLHKDSFSGLTKLKVLNLSSNCLVHLNPEEEEEQEAEKGNGNKRKHKSKNSPLSNKTEWIKDGIFAPLESLQILYLSFNHVENLDGLRSILPPTGGGNNEKQHKSYFKKIDLSGNAIASLAQVKESLVLQRGNLEDIRLAIHHPNDKKEEEEDLQQAWMDQLTRENPFISQNSINTNNNMYVEELLEYFPSLQVIDGQSHGVNPIEEENTRKVEALATINSATGTTIKETQKKEEEEEKKKLLDEMNYYYTLKSDVEELKDQLTHIKEIEINR
ncbi:Leucine rich repeat/Leucine Rich repeats (2 copies)/Leucine Rich repeat/Leucine Rich Repeat, putative [Angomonas deanei]|uniref:Leucine rich repeat/Leucine Rich repeats (2 copies)/Leucine Rich repeat/Leucine Rich Repeat, putative n=1 Tax=Angomonas deanei TaxID=59799 RepID=A0A7G2CBR5_9TRYP|nr:Leucine rich repeat/Leucine Rich repeats (2 copies)/Leucine Rich repeat/Leucine Rich Repeat, putative [Angomonas deanei]